MTTRTKDKSITEPVGLLANGVELFPPTVFDEQIFHGDITEIKVTNSGKDYDVITGPPLIINDQQGSGAIGHVNVSGSFREVKLVTPGIGYQEKPKITVTGGNGTGAVLESNLVRGRIVANFKVDGTSVDTFDESITFQTDITLNLEKVSFMMQEVTLLSLILLMDRHITLVSLMRRRLSYIKHPKMLSQVSTL